MLHKIRLVMVLLGAGAMSANLNAQGDLGGLQGRLSVTAAENQATSTTSRKAVLKVSLEANNLSIREVVDSLAKQANLRVSFFGGREQLAKKISIKLKEVGALEAIRQTVQRVGLRANLASDGETVVVGDTSGKSQIREQTTAEVGIITGQVLDSLSGDGIYGVTIQVIGHSVSAVSDSKGNFRISDIPANKYQVTFKLIGYKTVSRTVEVGANGVATVRVLLTGTANMLSGVVTTATGSQQKREVGNDIVSINVDSVMRLSPVSNISDLLATRVPGMTVQKTSGSPGAPSRIRIRGLTSMNSANDPIVIMDGIRMYSTQGITGSSNVPPTLDDIINGGGVGAGEVDRSTNMVGSTYGSTTSTLVSSPLDQIDPGMIETIEVLKGPSAVALYGADAANGVIVITTKRGTAGSTKWAASASYGAETRPGKWPINYWRWGSPVAADGAIGRGAIRCPVTSACHPDSLMIYQILNDKNSTIFGRGGKTEYRGEVRGGVRGIAYSFTGSVLSHTGMVKMPDVDVEVLNGLNTPLKSWQRKPQYQGRQSGSARFDNELKPGLSIAFIHSATRDYTRTTPLSNAISSSMRLFPGGGYSVGGTNRITEVVGSGILPQIPDYKKRISSQTVKITDAINILAPLTTLGNIDINVGMDMATRTDKSSLDRDDCEFCPTGPLVKLRLGELNNSNGSVMLASLRGSFKSRRLRLKNLISVNGSLGGEVSSSQSKDLVINAFDIARGATSANAAKNISARENRYSRSNAGIFAEVVVGVADKFYLPLSLRTDAGSALGAGVRPIFPRLSVSYVLSDKAGFSDIPVLGSLSTLRLRTAYGQAGVQPSVTAKLRLYSEGTGQLNGISVSTVGIQTIGNPNVRPEMSKELELGADIGVWNDRISAKITFFNKKTADALVAMDLPPSLGTSGTAYRTQMNLGVVKNVGFETDIDARVLENNYVLWVVSGNYASNKNALQKMGRSALEYTSRAMLGTTMANSTRFVEGYPLYGRWARPVMGFFDADGNGVLDANEIAIGDSSVYVGQPLPKYNLNFHTTLSFLTNFQISGSISYENGATQLNESIRGNSDVSRFTNDPTTPMEEQAYLVPVSGRLENRTDIGIIQSISVLRFNTVSINYYLPVSFTRFVSGKRLSFSVAGNNLGIISNYSGKDPSVNSSMDNVMIDSGVLPQPRTWTFKIGIN